MEETKVDRRPRIIVIRRDPLQDSVDHPIKKYSNRFWGVLIRQLRQEQGMSKRRLCAISKVNMRTVRNLEAGNAYAYIGLVERILDALGYDLEAIHKESLKAYSPRYLL